MIASAALPPAAFRDLGERSKGHVRTPGHIGRYTPLRNTIPTDAKEFFVNTWRWPDEPWPIERKQSITDCGWVVFSEPKDMLNLTRPSSPRSPCRSSRNPIREGQMILPHSGTNGTRPPVGARLCHGRD